MLLSIIIVIEMCIVQYTIATCPHCPTKVRRFSSSKLRENETEVLPFFRRCHNQYTYQKCFPQNPYAARQIHIWITRQDKDGRDRRTAQACGKHRPLALWQTIINSRRNEDLDVWLNGQRQSLNKHPKVLLRYHSEDERPYEKNADGDDLARPGISGRAGLEWATQAERKDANLQDQLWETGRATREAGWTRTPQPDSSTCTRLASMT